MTIDLLIPSAALLSGLLGGAHCAAMCGGIATGFSAMSTRQGWVPAVEANGGRVLGYVLAGLVAGGLGQGIVGVARLDWLALGLRMLVGGVLVLVALRMLDRKGRMGRLPGATLQAWRWLRPLQSRLLPANTRARRIGLGMLWGWLPCGLSTTLLAAAWLQADALNGALTMAAFGLGTLPMMLPLTWSGARMGRWLQRSGVRSAAGSLVLLAGLATLTAPWLAQVPAVHATLTALGCASLPD